ncbi:17259_t:CDS:2 [Rhizophagus irregularis]|nr:17259_t:CDS:2 [Rhizophagus irregularis]
MRIRRWTLEVLVNEIPLREYVISDSVLGASASNVLKSYVFEGNRKKFCDSATFIAVPGPGTYYSIVVSPSISKIAPKIYVDGRNDDSYVKSSDSSFSIVKGFHNRNRTIRYDFIFDKTEWIETDIPQRTKYGGLDIKNVKKRKRRYQEMIVSSAATNVDIKNEVNNFESDTENKPLITQSIKKRKRRYQEIIVILDSDEECTHEAVELD